MTGSNNPLCKQDPIVRRNRHRCAYNPFSIRITDTSIDQQKNNKGRPNALVDLNQDIIFNSQESLSDNARK